MKGDRTLIVRPHSKYRDRYKSRSPCSPVIPAVSTMMRRREFNQWVVHFNIKVGLMALLMEQQEERREWNQPRRWWVRPWLAQRPIYGQYEQLMGELMRENQTDFKVFFHVEPELFFELVDRVGPRLQKSTR